jgi:hypothetical protein
MLNNKTVVQGGAVISFLDGGPYEYGTSKVAVSYGNLLQGEYNRISTNTSAPGYGDWDASPLPNPQPVAFGPSIGNGNTIHAFQKSLATPYNEAWNVNVQRELPWNMFLKLAYVGNRDIHLPSYLNPINQPSPSVLQYGALLGQPVNSPAAVAAGIQVPYAAFIDQLGGSATVEQALDPFPQYTSVVNNFDLAGTTYYNAFQATGEKRMSNGLSLLATLTLSRNMSNVDTGFSSFAHNSLNKYNQRPEWSVSGLDQKYLNTYAAVYELPIGKGKKFLNTSSRVANVFIGGWQASAILQYGGGSPFSQQNGNGIINSAENPLQNGYNRPNIVPGVKLKTFNYDRAKDYFLGKVANLTPVIPTNAFVDAGSYSLGDAARDYASLRNPPYRMESLSGIKKFTITERVKAEFRVDYFNAFNRTQFENPDGNINDSTFGTVNSSGSQISNRQGEAALRLEF